MAKITTGYKRTGDLMTAQMYNELVDAVNNNDTDITAVKEQIEDITTHTRSQPSRGIYIYGTNLDSTIRDAVDGDWCVVLGSGNTFPGTIYTYNGSTWNSGGSWGPEGLDLTGYAKTTDTDTAIANSLAQATARMGYGECTVSGTALTVSIPNFILPTSGGTIHIKMSAAGTGASTLDINGTGAKTLWYNNAAVSAQNTWKPEEIISVFYDGIRFMAFNSQGGGGKAENIKYDNSQSGLASDNVQDAIDKVEVNAEKRELMDLSFTNTYNFNLEGNRTSWASSTSYKCIIVPRCLFGDVILFQPLTFKVSYAFLKYNNTKANTAVQFAGGMIHADTIQVGDEPKLVTIPNDCGCVYIYISNLSISTITTLFNIYSISYVKDIVGQLIAPNWDSMECNEVKGGIMPSVFSVNNGVYSNTYNPNTKYTRAISRIPFKLEEGEWLRITMDSSVKAIVKSIDNNGYYLGDDTGNPQTGGTLIVKGDGNKKVIWTALANDADILTANDVLSHISIVKGYDYRYEPTKVSVSERYNTTIQSEMIDNLALCSWFVYNGQGVPYPIPYQQSSNNRCCSASIEWIEDDILVSFPDTILSCCYDMGLDKIYKGRASLVVDKPYIVKGGRYIVLWFKKADDSVISSLSDFVAQISVTNISAEDTAKGLVENNILNSFNDTYRRKVFGIARSNNNQHNHTAVYTQMDFFNDYYQLGSLQSAPYNQEKGYILHLTGGTDGTICPIDGIGQYPMTLPSMGHENDAFIDGDEMWVSDGNALGSSGYTDISKYLFSTGTATKYTLDISSSVGATMVAGGVCKYDENNLLIASFDYRGKYNNEGDELRIYKVDKSTMAVELLFTTQWDGWFVQGMTYVNGFAYIATNMIPNGNVYTGINIWKIDMLGTPAHVETMQLFGDFEPEGLDNYSHNGIDYLLMGVGKYNKISQLTRMVAF